MSIPQTIEFDTRKAKRFHIVCFDLETSGLDLDDHEVIQIGAIKVNESLNRHVIKSFEMKVRMENPERASPSALKVNRYDLEVWAKEAVSKQEAAIAFAEWIVDGSDHVKFAGHNLAGFDWPRICRMFERADTKIMQVRRPRKNQEPEGEDDKGEFIKQAMIPGSGYHSLLDTGPMAAMLQLAVGQQELGSLSLRPLARYCGFIHDDDQAHEALYDCMTT
ncbi:unnamed protein product, partial [marine sediment metagenome]